MASLSWRNSCCQYHQWFLILGASISLYDNTLLNSGPIKGNIYIIEKIKRDSWWFHISSASFSHLWHCTVQLSVSCILIAIPVLKNMGRVIWSYKFILLKCFHLLYRASAPWAIIFAKWKLKDTPIKIVCYRFIVSCQCSPLSLACCGCCARFTNTDSQRGRLSMKTHRRRQWPFDKYLFVSAYLSRLVHTGVLIACFCSGKTC